MYLIKSTFGPPTPSNHLVWSAVVWSRSVVCAWWWSIRCWSWAIGWSWSWAISSAWWDNNDWAWDVVVIITAQDTTPEVDNVAAKITGAINSTAEQVANEACSCAGYTTSNVCGNG